MFRKILAKVLAREGGYSNDPDDAGGETIRGIARNYHPVWPGWKIVDERKSVGDPAYRPIDSQDSLIDPLVERFYKVQFWTPICGDSLTEFSIAERLFDLAVNLGPRRAAQMLQEALNLLNRNGSSWEEVVEDGIIGPKTLSTLNKASSLHVVRVLEALQGEHYINLVRRKPNQEKFLRGWLSRLD